MTIWQLIRTNLAKMVHAYAQAHGFSARLHLYSSGERLLAAFQRPEPIHLLFLDIYLPGLSGMETARRIRSAGNPTSIVFVTVSREHGMESFEVQAFDYLVKPFDLVLALPQNQPNAPLYPAGGAPGSRPGALPHFGRPRYLGPPPRARSTAG